jgi:hypothetical protein
LNGIYMIGMSLSMFPPETLGAIEAAAKKCAESGAFDPSALIMMSGMMGGGRVLLDGGATAAASAPASSNKGSTSEKVKK